MFMFTVTKEKILSPTFQFAEGISYRIHEGELEVCKKSDGWSGCCGEKKEQLGNALFSAEQYGRGKENLRAMAEGEYCCYW